MNMIKTKMTLHNDITGRKAANFVHGVTSKPYNIWIYKNDRMINAKSILGLLSLNLQSGDEVEVQISCDNENELSIICNEINN